MSKTKKLNQEIYQTVEENPSPTDTEVVGNIPAWIEGTLLRVGPGNFEWGDTKYNHWFDGDAILNRFEIKDGNVKFSSRFLRSNSYVESEKRGRLAYSHFGTVAPPDPCKNIFSRFFSYFSNEEETSDNCNVNVVKVRGDIYATADLTKLWKIEMDTLKSIQMLDLGMELGGSRSWTSHPHFDENGSHINISTDLDRNVYEIVKIPQEKDGNEADKIEIISSIPYKGKSAYIHSFSMTENYFVLIEGSLLYETPLKLKQKIMNLASADLLYFDKNKKSKLHVIERKSGKVGAIYEVEPYMCFHQINAYESNQELVFDTCFYPDSSVIDELYLRNLRSGKTKAIFPAEVRRYRLPLNVFNVDDPVTMALQKEDSGLDYISIHPSFEMPKINYEAYNGKKYKFTYGTGNSAIEAGLTTLLKINVDTKEVIIWENENCYPSEPVFIASPNATEEDEGVILSAVLGVRGNQSFLLILDATNMTEIARAYVADRLIPLFHVDFFK